MLSAFRERQSLLEHLQALSSRQQNRCSKENSDSKHEPLKLGQENPDIMNRELVQELVKAAEKLRQTTSQADPI